jgi:hypothetical protein
VNRSCGSKINQSQLVSNAWRIYELASGQSVDIAQDEFGGSIEETPPVPTTAIYSRTDGICAWQGCVEKTSARSEASRSKEAIAEWR